MKDKDVAKRMIKFLELNTIGASKDSQLRAAKILKAISDGYDIPISGNKQRKFFEFGRQVLSVRWLKLREAVKSSGNFSLPEFKPALCKFTGETAETYPGILFLRATT